MAVVAFCTDAASFLRNQILQKEIAQNYPGALWVAEFAQMAQAHGIEVLTGDLALQRVASGIVQPAEIWVIQEEHAILGRKLLQAGARPLALVCGESELYARNFYKKLSQISAAFPHRFLFRGAFQKTATPGENHVFYFPSFSAKKVRMPRAWSERKFLVMVAANKYWSTRRLLHRRIAAHIRDWIFGRNARVTSEMKRLQLHDRRLELIEYFGAHRALDLFGMGWSKLSNLPLSWELRLKDIVRQLAPTPCDNKQERISGYKFSLCIENYMSPGYVTEKILDCLHAGVIPVYLGAPDIKDFIARDAFIDIRDFESLDQLHAALQSMSEQEAMTMLDCGRQFLQSEAGQRYSYEGVAQQFLQVLLRDASK